MKLRSLLLNGPFEIDNRRRRPDLTAHQSASCFAAIEITSGLGSLFVGRAMRLGDPQRTMRPIPATSHHQLTVIELQLGVPCGPVHQSNPAYLKHILIQQYYENVKS